MLTSFIEKAYLRYMTQSYHHGDLRRAILDATLEIIKESGLNAVNMAEASRRAGVSSGAPYKHFNNKEALLSAIIEETTNGLLRQIKEGTSNAASKEEAFRQTGVIYAKWAAEHPQLFLMLMDPRHLDPDGEGEDYDFWRNIASLVSSGASLSMENPLIQQLSGRVMMIGLATLFANGVMTKLGVDASSAERISRALTGEIVPAESD